MLPPSPPSPPSGPPYGTYFSRRKLTQPAPPSPPLTKISISSTNTRAGRDAREGAPLSGSGGDDADVARVPAPLELDDAGDLREQRVVGAAADVEARLEPGAALTNEDAAATDQLPGKALDAEHLWIGVTAVAGATDAFLVSHVFPRPR